LESKLKPFYLTKLKKPQSLFPLCEAAKEAEELQRNRKKRDRESERAEERRIEMKHMS
jgi:hypothetical protein